MTVRSRPWLAAALGWSLSLPLTASAGEPGQLPLTSSNQQTADQIASTLRSSGRLQRYTIDIEFRDGTALLTGVVASAAQQAEAVRIAQQVGGVTHVVNRLEVTGAIQPVQVADAGRATVKEPELNGANGANRKRNDDTKNEQMPEPQPEFQAPPPAFSDANPPKMPPYAWPTYAPYNNFSRVACPTAYPYQAWPFIGPVYPFPKVPLSWRKVTLEWDDGHWWFSKLATKHDWWRLRYN